MTKTEIAPGSGWRHLGSAVWGNKEGVRVHVGGMVRLPSMVFFSLNDSSQNLKGWFLIKANGGNRKRGLMAWANLLFRGGGND